MNLDERDIEILKTLFDLGDPSVKHIAEETDIPKSTVHYRLQKLREMGIVENDLYEIDPDTVGLGVRIISEVTAEYEEGYHESIGTKLREIDGVASVYFTMGETDFIVIAYLPNSAYVQNLIQEYEAIDGVIRTNSTLVISTVQEDTNPLRGYSLEALKELSLTAEE